MSVADHAKRLAALIKKLPAADAPPAAPAPPHAQDRVVAELVRAFFVWEAGERRAEAALAEIHEAMVDYNELRVCLPHELARIVSDRDAKFDERCLRLRSTLNDIYRREHEISLAPLVSMPKRDARQRLETLEGVPPFVACRVALRALETHAFPLDARLAGLLAREKAIPADGEAAGADSIHAAAVWLEHHVRAEDAPSVYARMERWADAELKSKPAANTPKKGSQAGQRGTKAASDSSARPRKRKPTT